MPDGGLAFDLRAWPDAGESGGHAAARAPVFERPRGAEGLPAEFVALAGAGVSLEPLLSAAAEARRIGAAPFDVLLTSGLFEETELVAALARGLGVAAFGVEDIDGAGIDAETCAAALRTGVLRCDGADGRVRILLAARGDSVARLAATRRGRPVGGTPFALAGPRRFADVVVRRAGSALAAHAALGPGAVAPELTVAVAMPRIGWGVRTAAVGLVGLVAVSAFMVPAVAAALLSAAGLLFLALNLFRILLVVTPDTDDASPLRRVDRGLPVYTVMVGLMREGAVVPGLLDALERLDYPALCIKSTNRMRAFGSAVA